MSSEHMKFTTFCVNVDVDFAAHVRQRLDQDGLKVSELLRSLLQQWLEGGLPTVDDAYRQARSTAIQLARGLIIRAYQELPETYEEAIHLLAALDEELRAHNG